MATSEDRIEVAAKLRQMADEHDTIHAFSSADMRKLAELIDPTCHVVPFDEESMRLPHCSKCGQPILKPWPNFCPNCGARVVNSDDQ